jgi:yeast amino acid transporter
VIKIMAITAMIVACLVTSLGGGPRHERIGFRYWKHEAFREHVGIKGNLGRFLAFWSAMVQACFAYTGAEIVGASFGEVPNPRKNIPKAIKLTAFRILSVYILGVFVITMSVSPNSKFLLDAMASDKKSGGKFYEPVFSMRSFP